MYSREVPVETPSNGVLMHPSHEYTKNEDAIVSVPAHREDVPGTGNQRGRRRVDRVSRLHSYGRLCVGVGSVLMWRG